MGSEAEGRMDYCLGRGHEARGIIVLVKSNYLVKNWISRQYNFS